ncbi:putative inorganic phosphate cotransporter [Bradysia coprophila]|uniref:putative inorganic phosphate cotransporter n=1 Tax=Bradysia coprophila TaxID=38358 RepID=UPI00187D772A|nr:putative inorganic phosphate cotransporter [Bradysia coprophila]
MLTGWRKTLSKFFIIPHRLIVSTMGFLAIMLAYTIRTSLSLSITKMVKSHGHSASAEECLVEDNGTPGDSKPGGDFDWSEELQGVILASFYIGYVITHVPGGVVASRYGGKITLLVGMTVAAFFTLITPVCVESGGAAALITLRIIIGLGEGLIFPSCNALLAAWVPLAERSKMGTLTYSGAQIGSIFGSLVSGALLSAYDGWASVFYFFGGISFIWIVIFALICYKDPDSHPFVSDKEKEHLEREMGQIERDKNRAVPWRHILSSPAVIALIFAQLGHNWGFFIMVTDLPKYMNDVLKFSIKENGFYNALPYLAMWIVAQLTGFLSDFIIAKRYMSITNVRKFFTILAAVGPGCFIIGASYAGCNKFVVVALFTIGMGFMGTFYSGLKVNNLDLAPNFAGVIMAITNGVGGINGILAPYIVGVLTPNSLMNEWRIVFWTAFVIFALTSVIYGIWASGELQPWNNLEKETLAEGGDVSNKSVENVKEKLEELDKGEEITHEEKSDFSSNDSKLKE